MLYIYKDCRWGSANKMFCPLQTKTDLSLRLLVTIVIFEILKLDRFQINILCVDFKRLPVKAISAIKILLLSGFGCKI